MKTLEEKADWLHITIKLIIAEQKMYDLGLKQDAEEMGKRAIAGLKEALS